MSKKMIETVPLADMRRRLQARLQYDNPDLAFDTLLYAFCYKRYGPHSAASQRLRIEQQGWMTIRLAREFAQYVGYPIERD